MTREKGTKKAVSATPDRAAMAAALAAFLDAAGIDRSDPEVAETPARAAAAWADEFLDGYQRSAREALGGLSAAPKGGGIVVVTGLDYTGVCPHHLLPYRGVAHVAYKPGRHVAGFGRLALLVDAFAHRLTLQETLADQLAGALAGELGATGAAVILDAEQSCLTMRGEKRAQSRTIVDASVGVHGDLALERLWASVKMDSPLVKVSP